MGKCDCLLKAFGLRNRAELAEFSEEKLKKRFRNLSLLVHPDKHAQSPEDTQNKALRAQQLLILASKTLLDKEALQCYISDGTSDPDTEHDCETNNNTIDFIGEQVNLFISRHSNKQISATRATRAAKTTKTFEPEGYQLGGVIILDSKPRPREHAYQVDWLLKPGNPAWLKESEVVKHYPIACIEYIQKLRKTKATRKLANIAKNAGPITRYM